MARKQALGRGLSTILKDAPQRGETTQKNSITAQEIPIEAIQINPLQPRKEFNEEKITELSQSIKNMGLITPLTVRKIEEKKYQLIAGERRFRASQLAGLQKVPVYTREVDDKQMLELALVENIQREDLNALEVAIAYERLMEECNLTQEQLSDRVGKKRSTVSNYIRLLKLPAEIQKGIKEQKISMGHAKALINVKDVETQVMLFGQIEKYELSVRKTEELVRELEASLDPKIDGEAKEVMDREANGKVGLSPTTQKLKEELMSHLQRKITVNVAPKGNGKLSISFSSDEDLGKLVKALIGNTVVH